jgi:hypothetical protein
MTLQIAKPLKAQFRNDPVSLKGYSYGNFSALVRNQPDISIRRSKVAQRLQQIQEVANQVGAKMVVPMVPASVQVCKPNELPYYPRNVNLANTQKFDPELPQRMTQELTQSLSIGYYDLRPALQAQQCPYQPHNMHWLPSGHRAVADYLSKRLIADGYLKPSK